ncbi:MAG TPA: hypothetical protein VGD67_10085, partial [Pseudonocardiaceae bacterium]
MIVEDASARVSSLLGGGTSAVGPAGRGVLGTLRVSVLPAGGSTPGPDGMPSLDLPGYLGSVGDTVRRGLPAVAVPVTPLRPAAWVRPLTPLPGDHAQPLPGSVVATPPAVAADVVPAPAARASTAPADPALAGTRPPSAATPDLPAPLAPS